MLTASPYSQVLAQVVLISDELLGAQYALLDLVVREVQSMQ